jgi:hypothetical protein
MLDKMKTMRSRSLLLKPRVCWSGDNLKNKGIRRHPRPSRKCPRRQDVLPRGSFPSAQTSECASLY